MEKVSLVFRLMGARIFLVVLICLLLASSMVFAPTMRSLNGQSSNSMKGQEPPVMIGWGGLRLDSATTTCSSVCYHNSTYVPSNVFPAQNQSDMERLVVSMKAMGLNTIRVSFSPFCTNPAGDRDDSPYSFSDAQNMIKIANYYNFWIALRYDGNDDISTATTCWLNYWQPIVQQLGPLYSQIVWEPINEPNATVTALSSTYQQWINMTRKAGDQHFIVIENQCSNKCPYSDLSQGYPTVTDPLGKVLISLHNYMSYPSSGWTVPDAIRHAQQDYQAVLKGEQVTGWYALDTEGGPDPHVTTCNGPTGTTSGCPPDDMLPGSAGYANVSLAFIQELTRLFDNHGPRINWVWWPAGTWTDTPCAGTYSALQPAYCPGGTGYKGGVGWGTLLNYIPLAPLSAIFNFSPLAPSAGTIVSFNAIGSGGAPPYSFRWDFGDGTTSDVVTSTHSYANLGHYTVILTTNDSSDQTVFASQVVDVHARQPPENQPGGSICLACFFTPLLPVLFLVGLGAAYG